uniref:Uncharacterized protein n=1 Tax=Lepeophtheirus salmonis TaxID=72036 RepID=A0A0K2T7T1_LEPSM
MLFHGVISIGDDDIPPYNKTPGDPDNFKLRIFYNFKMLEPGLLIGLFGMTILGSNRDIPLRVRRILSVPIS